jgi:hypothetical protein
MQVNDLLDPRTSLRRSLFGPSDSREIAPR